MVGAGVTFDARTELVVLERGNQNAATYITNILEPHIVPFRPFIGITLFLPHVAGIVQHYFREVEIGQMQWPARSSDLNLIE
jgi:hypothetical protein